MMNPEEHYYHTKESVEEYMKAAEGFNGQKLIDKLINFLPKESVLLELGSGPGKDLEILSRKYTVIGSDFSKEFLQHLKATHPQGEFLELNAIDLNTEKTFDGIYSNKVLHHLSDEELRDSFERQYKILNEGGIICHSFWKGEGSEFFKGMFVNYHHEESLKEFFNDYFEILSLDTYGEFAEGDSMVLYAKKLSVSK